MTWSVVTRDPQTGHLAIAVATRFFAVGSVVPHIRGGVGAVATQAFSSPLYGTDGLLMLAEGKAPQDVITALTGRDAGHEQRQLHLIDSKGRNAAFTGAKCIDWAGHLVDDNVSVAGNMLSGPQVIAETLATFKKTAGKPLAERLLEAMQAGEDAGGDKRGRQSAALLIYRDQDFSWMNIRVDDHADPLAELRRLYAVAQERYLPVTETMPTRQNPSGMIDRREIDAEIARMEAEQTAAGQSSASFATSPKNI
jgi:uncharacterized Ntn-hydrolase superfamily protein